MQGSAETLHHLGAADTLVFDRIEQFDRAVLDQLHQVFVGGHNGHPHGFLARQPRIGRDQIVSLEALLFDAGYAERARCLSHQGKLRDQIFGRIGPIGFILGIDRVAKCDLARVEDNRQMAWFVAALGVFEQLPQHVTIARHRARR